jgi:branched-chain amino acid transport system permease protein
MVFRTSGVVNFAQGEFMTVAAYAFVPLAAREVNSFVSLLVPVSVGLLMGLFFFTITELFLAKAQLLMQMMATFALSLLIVSVLIVTKGDQTVPVAVWFKGNSLFYVLGAHVTGQEIIEIVSTVLIVVVLEFTIRFTAFGKNIEAVSENRKASSLCGISPRTTIAACWMIGGALTAFAGILYAPLAGVSPQMGAAFLFPSFVAATIGGFNSVAAAATGGVAVGIVISLATHFFGGGISTVAVFVVLVLVLLVRPNGFGAKFEMSRV